MKTNSKVALVGCRNVAPASAYSLLNGRQDVEVVLIGEYAESLFDSVAELTDQLPLRTGSTVRVGEPEHLRDAAICVLSSGTPPVENDTEDSFLSRNIEIVRSKGESLRDNGFKGVLVVTTQPAEIMAQAAMEASGLSCEAVVGIGPGSLASLVRDGRSLPLATWCSAAGCDVEYVDSCHPDCPYFEGMLERFHKSQRTDRHFETGTMASCVMRVCESILSDEKAVLPVATMLNGQHAIVGTFTSVPCVIGKHGVERILELQLTDVEHKNLLDAARETGRLFYRLTKRAMAATNAKPA